MRTIFLFFVLVLVIGCAPELPPTEPPQEDVVIEETVTVTEDEQEYIREEMPDDTLDGLDTDDLFEDMDEYIDTDYTDNNDYTNEELEQDLESI